MEGAHLQICNIFTHPLSSCPPGYAPAFTSVLAQITGDVLLLGDFDAIDALWYSSTLDGAATNRGANIVETLYNTTLVVINQNSPTRVPSSGLVNSPDITITNTIPVSIPAECP